MFAYYPGHGSNADSAKPRFFSFGRTLVFSLVIIVGLNIFNAITLVGTIILASITTALVIGGIVSYFYEKYKFNKANRLLKTADSSDDPVSPPVSPQSGRGVVIVNGVINGVICDKQEPAPAKRAEEIETGTTNVAKKSRLFRPETAMGNYANKNGSDTSQQNISSVPALPTKWVW